MGLSKDPAKAERQLANLAAGRRAMAERLLGGTPAKADPAPAKADPAPAKAAPAKRQPQRVSHAKAAAKATQGTKTKTTTKRAPAAATGSSSRAPGSSMGHGRSLLHGMLHPLD